ncbi:hypothetical protein AVEN_201882-1 [Araneus ventricosus]|uniref:Uncharacterized protein n=1 Tax=Araneus ventricosus TaxID=182803 RepID=A0A4Y2G2I7_ARAVE|nr:hypothetical protein AVEN_201882-1 [Araneus ventricosus]
MMSGILSSAVFHHFQSFVPNFIAFRFDDCFFLLAIQKIPFGKTCEWPALNSMKSTPFISLPFDLLLRERGEKKVKQRRKSSRNESFLSQYGEKSELRPLLGWGIQASVVTKIL